MDTYSMIWTSGVVGTFALAQDTIALKESLFDKDVAQWIDDCSMHWQKRSCEDNLWNLMNAPSLDAKKEATRQEASLPSCQNFLKCHSRPQHDSGEIWCWQCDRCNEAVCDYLDGVDITRRHRTKRSMRILAVLSLLLGKTLLPTFQWLALPESPQYTLSPLDTQIKDTFPWLRTVLALKTHPLSNGMTPLFLSTILASSALLIPVTYIRPVDRTAIYSFCAMSFLFGASLSAYAEASALEYFVILMPLSFSVGISLGMAWRRARGGKGGQIAASGHSRWDSTA